MQAGCDGWAAIERLEILVNYCFVICYPLCYSIVTVDLEDVNHTKDLNMFSLSRHPKDSIIVEPTEVMEETKCKGAKSFCCRNLIFSIVFCFNP